MKCPKCGADTAQCVDVMYTEMDEAVYSLCEYECECGARFDTSTRYERTEMELVTKVYTEKETKEDE